MSKNKEHKTLLRLAALLDLCQDRESYALEVAEELVRAGYATRQEDEDKISISPKKPKRPIRTVRR